MWGHTGLADSRPGSIVHRTAVATASAAFLLIVAGGLVTSRDAGLAVPDWPLAFGQLNPPRWWQIDNVRTEHGHRILAFLVASLTAVLAGLTVRSGIGGAARKLAIAAAVLVLIQAGLGGLRVLQLSLDLAMIHAWMAQMYFGVLVALATVTSKAWAAPCLPPIADARSAGLAGLAPLTTVVIVLQLVAGIFLRHHGESIRPLLGHPVFYLHVASALLLLFMAAALASSDRDQTTAPARSAQMLLAMIVLQILLGIATWLATETMTGDRQATMIEAWIPTLHVAVGAACLAAALVTSLLRSDRRASPGPAAGEGAEPAHVASGR